MRIDELKKEIKILSDEKGIMLRVIKESGYICIQRQHGLWREIALIKLDENFVIDTDNCWFEILEEEIKEKIFDILVKFARTPTDEREEEKKYQYRLKGKYWWIIEDFDKTYLNWLIDEEGARPLTLNDRYEAVGVETSFTDEEIEELAKKHGVDLDMFDKIEVE